MPVERKVLQDIVEDLKGQCSHDLEHFLEVRELSSDDLTKEDEAYIDDNVFLCEVCGWWCGSDEMSGNGDMTCDECTSDEDDD